jgi:hypothetical protein
MPIFSFGLVVVMFLLNGLVDCCNINPFIEISKHAFKVIGLCDSAGLVTILIFDLQNSFNCIHRFHIDAVARIVHALEAFGLRDGCEQDEYLIVGYSLFLCDVALFDGHLGCDSWLTAALQDLDARKAACQVQMHQSLGFLDEKHKTLKKPYPRFHRIRVLLAPQIAHAGDVEVLQTFVFRRHCIYNSNILTER